MKTKLSLLVLLAGLVLASDATARVFVATNSTWRYFKGTSEASTPTNAWRELAFDDSAWLTGSAPFHYGTNTAGGDDTLTGGTVLTDMRSNYTCVFLRQTFVLADTNGPSSLVLNAWMDDGLAIWINGQVARNPAFVSGLANTNTATSTREGSTRLALALSSAGGLLRAGTNVLCLQAFNRSLTDDDFRIDVELVKVPAPVQFNAATYNTAESAGAVTLIVERLNDTYTVVSVDYFTADGTATNGIKYAAVSGTLVFGVGETNKTIVVPILNNGLVEGSKSFNVILSNPVNAVLGTRTNATVSITDNDAGVAFVLASSSVAEEAGAAQIGVVRGDDGISPVTVDLATTDVTATSGLDYTGITNTISFAPTERFKLVTIPILNDGLKEANETFLVTLSNPTGGPLGGTKTTTITIVDNDSGFQFDSATYSVAEDAGAVLINVTRGDDTNLAASVEYATSDLTATNGLDYTGSTNTLAFAPGEKTRLVSVPILNDGITEPTETFRVTLSNPSGGLLGTRTINTVSILDNDARLGFELGSYSVWEGAGEVNLIILRGNDWNLGPITVKYATSNLTATAGPDYQAISGTLEFQENETVKSLTIPIFRDILVEGTETFRVTLSNATGGAALGMATTTVTIQDNDFTVVPPFDSMLAVRREGAVNMLTWVGGGQLQRADRVDGPWQTLAAARSPCAVRSLVPASFYKVIHPRPAKLYVPSGYNFQTPAPLVVLLHGRGWDGQQGEDYVQFRPLAETRGFLYCYPDASASSAGNLWNANFWNDADAAAANLSNVDDVGYLRNVIEEVARRFALDRKRVHLFGHSNGGFMSCRMACESADLIASIASLAGTRTLPVELCQPSRPVNLLQIHGTADAEVHYEGGAWTIPSYPWNTFPYSSVMLNLQNWAAYNGATNPTTDTVPSLDLTLDLAGLDTVVTRYTTFPPGGAVELWTINGGGHVPTLSSQFSPRVIDWLLAHPKP